MIPKNGKNEPGETKQASQLNAKKRGERKRKRKQGEILGGYNIDSIELTFPKEIEKEIRNNFEKQQNQRDEEEKEAYLEFLSPDRKIKGQTELLKEFLLFIKNPDLIFDFKILIENFRDLNLYERFLAAVRIYLRTDKLNESFDKFLYLCIAVEAPIHYNSNEKKEKGKLFIKFFKDNLSNESKLKLISNFKSKRVKNIADATSLRMCKYGYIKKPEKIPHGSLLPSCYKQNHCGILYGRCNYKPNQLCFLKSNPEKIDDHLYLVSDFLYKKRSDFVHEGKIFHHPMNDPDKPNPTNRSDGVWKNPISNNQEYKYEYTLDLNDLFCIYEEALLNYFKKLSGV